RGARGAPRRLRRGDHAHARGHRRGRAGRDGLRRPRRRDRDPRARDGDPPRDHPRLRDQDRPRARLRGAGEAADPLRPLRRRRGVHVRNRRRGDARALRRRPRGRRRRGDAGDPARVPGRRARGDRRVRRVARARARRGTGVSLGTRAVALSAPWIDERDEELVLEVLRSGRLSLGPTGPRFEELLAETVGAAHCAAVSSGTAGLHLCMRLAGVGPGDEVITSPYSFVASANCAIYEGATPVFADVDPRTLNLDPAAVEAAVTPRTRAIVAVDIFGYPCELDELRALCDRHGLALVEDACEALGARYKGRLLGAHGHPAVFAFYPNKQMTTGEGGAVTTS